jgi:Bacterial PH domain
MKAVNLAKLLPADIPTGERILWHGRPRWFSMARRAYGTELVAVYFGAMTIVNFAWSTADADLRDAAISAVKTMGAGALALTLLGLMAWLASRTSLYIVTSKRVVLKIGIALPIFFNIPFSSIESAALRVFSDETGDISLRLGSAHRLAYLHLWPHARTLRLKRPEPALRSVGRSAEVAGILSRALTSACNESTERDGVTLESAPERTADANALYTEDVVAAA